LDKRNDLVASDFGLGPEIFSPSTVVSAIPMSIPEPSSVEATSTMDLGPLKSLLAILGSDIPPAFIDPLTSLLPMPSPTSNSLANIPTDALPPNLLIPLSTTTAKTAEATAKAAKATAKHTAAAYVKNVIKQVDIHIASNKTQVKAVTPTMAPRILDAKSCKSIIKDMKKYIENYTINPTVNATLDGTVKQVLQVTLTPDLAYVVGNSSSSSNITLVKAPSSALAFQYAAPIPHDCSRPTLLLASSTHPNSTLKRQVDIDSCLLDICVWGSVSDSDWSS